MKTFFLRFFTWWNGQTFGTQLWTWLYGELVGEDEFGNRYFRTRGGKIDPTLLMRAALGDLQRRRRALDGAAVVARLAASHGRYAADRRNLQAAAVAEAAPPESDGHAGAQRPTGSTLAQGRRPKATGDYKAWTPGR